MTGCRYAVIGSGSQSNSYIFSDGTESWVIDNGFSLREFKKRLRQDAFHLDHIKGIFLTHNHGDHIKGLEALARDRNVPVYLHESTSLYGFVRDPGIQSVGIKPGTSYKIGKLDVYPFPLHHDAPNALGYHFKLGGTIFTLITDTGKTDGLMLKLALRSDVLFLESNYCPELLKTGPYPKVLRDRVASDRGHLSNHQAVSFLNQIHDAGSGRLKKVYLVHLSSNNNTPQRLQETLDKDLKWSGSLQICRRSEFVPGRMDIP